jgi:hypothetical protein
MKFPLNTNVLGIDPIDFYVAAWLSAVALTRAASQC